MSQKKKVWIDVDPKISVGPRDFARSLSVARGELDSIPPPEYL